jgi:hypothetical protein
MDNVWRASEECQKFHFTLPRRRAAVTGALEEANDRRIADLANKATKTAAWKRFPRAHHPELTTTTPENGPRREYDVFFHIIVSGCFLVQHVTIGVSKNPLPVSSWTCVSGRERNVVSLVRHQKKCGQDWTLFEEGEIAFDRQGVKMLRIGQDN